MSRKCRGHLKAGRETSEWGEEWGDRCVCVWGGGGGGASSGSGMQWTELGAKRTAATAHLAVAVRIHQRKRVLHLCVLHLRPTRFPPQARCGTSNASWPLQMRCGGRASARRGPSLASAAPESRAPDGWGGPERAELATLAQRSAGRAVSAPDPSASYEMKSCVASSRVSTYTRRPFTARDTPRGGRKALLRWRRIRLVDQQRPLRLKREGKATAL